MSSDFQPDPPPGVLAGWPVGPLFFF